MQDSHDNGDAALVVSLPPVLGMVEAAELKLTLEEAMINRRGVRIEACDVQRISTLGLQVLVAAARSYAEQGLPYGFGARSVQVNEGAELLGLAQVLGIDGD